MHAHAFDNIPLFAGLSADERLDLARLGTIRDFPANEVLFWIGDAGDEFFVVLSGRIRVTYPDETGREITLAVLNSGDFVGEVSLLDGGPRTATTRAGEQPVSLLCLNRAAFQRFIRQCPSAALHMLSVLGHRQRDSLDKLRGLRNLNEVMEQRLTAWQHVAGTIAAMAANQWFLFAHACAFGSWIAINLTLGPRGPDPFPFPFLCFWTSCEAIFLSLFILISQNAQGQKDRIRTEMEYQTALKAQVEVMQLHHKVDDIPAAVIAQLRASGELPAARPTATAPRAGADDLVAPPAPLDDDSAAEVAAVGHAAAASR